MAAPHSVGVNGGEMFLSEEALIQAETTLLEMRRHGWLGSRWGIETMMVLTVQNLRSKETGFIRELLPMVLQRYKVWWLFPVVWTSQLICPSGPGLCQRNLLPFLWLCAC